MDAITLLAAVNADEAVRAIDHASQQGVVWFLSAVVLGMAIIIALLLKFILGALGKHTEAQFGLIKECTAQMAANTKSLDSKVEILTEMRATLHDTRDTLSTTREALAQIQSSNRAITTALEGAASMMNRVSMHLNSMQPMALHSIQQS